MKIEMQSTRQIVAIQGVPCRKWKVDRVDGIVPVIESHVFTRMLAIDADIEIDDHHVYLLDGPEPPSLSDFPNAIEIE